MSALLQALWKSKRALIAAIILSLIILAALLADLYPLSPVDQNLALRLRAPGLQAVDGKLHLLGTDQLGRDLLARILHGARISLLVGLVSVTIAAIIGAVMGILAGYYGGRIDSIIMTLVETLLSLPFIVLAIAIIGALGPSLTNIIVVLAGTGWVTFAKLMRGKVMEIKEGTYVEAARALGVPTYLILFRHILPNAVSLVFVEATLQVGQMMLTEASLSFLGLGIQPPTPSWGGILNDGKVYIYLAWWVTTFPGMAIALTILSTNLLGDFLRDYFDPEVVD